MKTKKTLALAALLAAAVTGWKTGAFENLPNVALSPAYRPPTTPALAPYAFDFGQSAGCLPSPCPWPVTLEDDTTDNHDPAFRIFFSPGDGSFALIDTPSLDNTSLLHVFDRPGTYTPYAEVTGIYDKDKHNAIAVRSSASVTTSVTPTVSTFNTVNMNGKTAAITAVRNPRVGDLMTYVVSYENPTANPVSGRLEIDYSSGLVPRSATPYQTFFGENPDTVSAHSLEFPVSNLTSGAQRHIFLHFNPQALTALSEAEAQRRYDLTACFRIDGASPGASDCASHSSVAYESHDPNHKWATPNLCEPNPGEWVYFAVEVKNTGAGPAQRIEFRDELDPWLDPSTVQIDTAAIWGTPELFMKPLGPHATELVVIFKTASGMASLHGRAHPQAGQAFSLEETERTFRFHAQTLPNANPSCSAICNRARVVFDCHPAEWTNLTFSKFGCNGNCDHHCQDSLAGAWTRDADQDSIWNAENRSWYTFLDTSDFRFKWYPASMVSNPYVLNPDLTPTRPTRFVLVASKNCKRYVFYFDVAPSCPFDIQAPPGLSVDCADQFSPSFNAEIIPATAFNPHMVWNNCTTGQTTTYQGKPAGEAVIAVTDTSTGCVVRKTVLIQAPPPLRVEDDPTDCTAGLQVSGGVPPYQYQWQPQPDGPVAANTSSSQWLLFYPHATVTVTDANGCSVVFAPRRGPIWTCIPWGMLFFATLLLGGAWIYLRSRKGP